MSDLPPAPLRVATWNVYLGADLEPLLATDDADTLAKATREVLAQAERTRFPERADVIAAAIGDARPDVIGLQELGRWHIDSSDGREVLWDHEQLVMAALERRGEAYIMLYCSDTFTGTLPLDDGRTVTFTNCDAMLLRASTEREVVVHDADQGHFDARVHVELPAVRDTMEVRRGWVQADLEIEGHLLRVVSTHLDASDDAVRLRQAHELVAVMSHSPHPVVVVGDLNAGPEAPELDVLRRAGYADAWTEAGGGEGPTWGAMPELDDLSRGLRERLDYVLYDPGHVSATRVERIGLGDAARTGGSRPLWASDHAGVLAETEVS